MRRIRKINKKGYKHLHKYCFFCGEDDYDALHCHRIVPGEQGGTYHAQNTLTVCASCHAKIHSGRIKIDRKYQQATSPLFKVHYWVDGEEFWRNEEIGIFTAAEHYHSGLGRSRKAFKKRGWVQGSTDHNQIKHGNDQGDGGGEVRNDSALLPQEKTQAAD